MSPELEPQAASFAELRRKVQLAQLLSSSTESLLRSVQFTGRLSVVIQNGVS